MKREIITFILVIAIHFTEKEKVLHYAILKIALEIACILKRLNSTFHVIH